jgi:ribokinase
VRLDALVGSDLDPSEAYAAGDIDPPPGLVVKTRGSSGGTFQVEGEGVSRYAAVAPPEHIVDRYGAGDAFAAGLTFALGLGYQPGRAVELAARCGAAVLGGRGPFETQLRHDDLL